MFILRCVLAAALLFCATLCRTQDFSNKGKDFWLAYPAHIDGTTSRMALYISSQVNTTGSVQLGSNSISFSVVANQATVVQIFPSTYPVINSQNEGIKVGAGIHVTAGAPVVVYAHILNMARSGSSLILPTNTLGREYTAVSFQSSTNAPAAGANGSPSGSQFTVVAVENNTTVEIVPSVADVTGTRQAGTPYTVQLNRGDVYQFRSTFDKDVTGSKIRSLAAGGAGCKPIAVFSGSSWTSLDCAGAAGGDNLFQQLMPITAWGKEYLTAPFADRQYDIFRVVVRNSNTVVRVNGVALNAGTLVGNAYYQFSSSSPNIIQADAPVMVVQYMVSQNCDTRNGGGTGNNVPWPGDPEMVILNAIEQTVNDVTVVSARNNLTPPQTNITKHFFTIITKTSALASLRVDGAPPTGAAIPIGNTGYAYLHENVTASTVSNPSHRITADSGFIALAYGLGPVESYGYNAGTNVRDLYQYVSLQNEFATVNFPSTCNNTPFFFSMTFPYQPTQIKWVFGQALNSIGIADVTINSPAFDSVWTVNGRQLYRYRLPGTYTIPTVGTFPIRVIAQNPTPEGCSGEQEINYDVQVFQRPTSNFSFNGSGCLPDSIRFTDGANSFGRGITRFSWDFGDGNPSAIRNPSHLFKSVGSYTVKYAIVTDIGCVSDTAIKTVDVSDVPLTAFSSVAPYCEGASIRFADQSTVRGSTVTKWSWDFGDGGSSGIANPTHTYAKAGSYLITLRVESDKGCAGKPLSKRVDVGPVPRPGFQMPGNCINDPVTQFTDTSTIADGSEAQFTYAWQFGDPNANVANPNNSTLKNPLHRYTATGDYPVTLSVTSNKGCTAGITQTFTINGAVPVAAFTITNGNQYCGNDTVSLTDNSSVLPGRLVKLEIYWDYAGDPSNKTVILNPKQGGVYRHKYPEFFTPATKPYAIRVIAYSGVNCLSSTEQTLTLKAIPDISFEPVQAVCANVPALQFRANVQNNLAGAGVFSGSPAVSSSGRFQPSVAGPGNHLVRYTYTAGNGCVSSIDQMVTVFPIPTVNAGPDRFVLEGGTIKLTPIATGVGLQFEWSPATYLNDAKSAQPVATPASDINYLVRVTSADGCQASDGVMVTVLKAPTVPNVFTPNGDGINDRWEIKYLDSYPAATVEVFNRYGSMVYRSVGYGTPWDGRYNGGQLPAGTYYYIINPKNGRSQISGFVDIVR